MKKALLFTCSLALIAGLSCKKQSTANNPSTVNSVSTDYKAFIIEFTATWCPHCGTYAYPSWKAVFPNHQYKVTGISVHEADDIVVTDYPAQAPLQNFYQCAGYPTSGYGVTGNGYPSAGYYDGPINTAVAANAQAKAGIGIAKSISGNTMTVTTKTVFFQDVQGPLNLAVYMTEDGIVNDQNTETTMLTAVTHDHVFRGSAGDAAFGSLLVAGNGVKGSTYDKTYTINIPSDVRNRNNLHIVVVLFRVDPVTGNPTDVINSNTI